MQQRITQDGQVGFAAWSIPQYWWAENDDVYKVPPWWSGWSLGEVLACVFQLAVFCAMLYACGRLVWAFGRVLVAMWGG